MTNPMPWELALTKYLIKKAQHFTSLLPEQPLSMQHPIGGSPAMASRMFEDMHAAAQKALPDILKELSEQIETWKSHKAPAGQLTEGRYLPGVLRAHLLGLAPEKHPVLIVDRASAVGDNPSTNDLLRFAARAHGQLVRFLQKIPHASSPPTTQDLLAQLVDLLAQPETIGNVGVDPLYPRVMANRPTPYTGVVPMVRIDAAYRFVPSLAHEIGHVMFPAFFTSVPGRMRQKKILAMHPELTNALALKALFPHFVEEFQARYGKAPMSAILLGQLHRMLLNHYAHYLAHLYKNQSSLPVSVPLTIVDLEKHLHALLEAPPESSDPWRELLRRYSIFLDKNAPKLSKEIDFSKVGKLARLLSYAAALPHLEKRFPDPSNITYADFLNALKETYQDPTTRHLFELAMRGPETPAELESFVQEVNARAPAAKNHPFVQELSSLVNEPFLYEYLDLPGEYKPSKEYLRDARRAAPLRALAQHTRYHYLGKPPVRL